MKYTYNFATENQSVEIDEKWVEVLNELDRLETNNNHTETRRHTTLDNDVDDGKWLVYIDTDIEKLFAEPTLEERLRVAISMLKPKQNELIKELFYNGLTQKEYAEKHGITQGAVSQRLETAKKFLKKFF